MNPLPLHSPGQRGFTLIELLIVVAVTVLLLSLLSIATGSVMRGLRLDDAGRILVSEFEYARQLAVARNRNAEVRLFYKARYPGEPFTYHSLQVGIMDAQGVFLPVGKMNRLPEGIVLSERSELSSIIAALDPGGNDERYLSIVIRPTGFLEPQTNLGLNAPWFITAVFAEDRNAAPDDIVNFASMQVSPTTGRTVLYRP